MTDAEMMAAMAEVLRNYCFTDVPDGEYTESYNNDDVFEVLDQYEQHIAKSDA